MKIYTPEGAFMGAWAFDNPHRAAAEAVADIVGPREVAIEQAADGADQDEADFFGVDAGGAVYHIAIR